MKTSWHYNNLFLGYGGQLQADLKVCIVSTFWKAHKIWENLPLGLDVYQVNVQSIWKIAQIFVCFSESLNFIYNDFVCCCTLWRWTKTREARKERTEQLMRKNDGNILGVTPRHCYKPPAAIICNFINLTWALHIHTQLLGHKMQFTYRCKLQK